jgi:hypothetical protein
MMTRKDFELIAEVLASVGNQRGAALLLAMNVSGDGTYLEGWNDAVEEVALQMSERLKETNDRFDRIRFLRASGVPEVRIVDEVGV